MRIQRGTRVVVRVAVAAAHDIFPAGSVAEVVSVDERGPVRVRFWNGHETDIGSDEFDLLGDVKNHAAHGVTSPDELRRHVILDVVVGSRAFGLATEGSDTDRRGVYQAPTDLVLSLYETPPQLENEENQECFWELKKFLVLALKANPNILEVLFSPEVVFEAPAGRELRAMRGVFLSRLVFQTYNGYVMSQFKKMLRSLELAAEPNWKHAMHLIRLLESGIAILETGEPLLLTEHREKLLAVKRGEWPWERVDVWRREMHARFEAAFVNTALPERPDVAAANRFLLRARRGEFTT